MDRKERPTNQLEDSTDEGREKNFMDIDRMVNEGLGSGRLINGTGLIEKRASFPESEIPPTLNGEIMADADEPTDHQ